MVEFISQPWPWYIGGPIIGLIMLALLFFGGEFGVSANLRTLCSMCGAGKKTEFFQFEWKKQIWNIVFIIGAVLGGFFTNQYLSDSTAIDLSKDTIVSLSNLGFSNVGETYVPSEIFGEEAITTWQGLLFLIVGGMLVGFGSRYAGGCTSGHAISGLSNFQLPSLIAVIGFFIGGLITTFLLIPLIF